MGRVDEMPTTYEEAAAILGKRTICNIANNTWLEASSGYIYLMLYRTPVVTFRSDDSVILNAGAWRTVTTKRRMNAVLETRLCCVFQRKFNWYVATSDGITVEYFDFIRLDWRGRLCAPVAPATP